MSGGIPIRPETKALAQRPGPHLDFGGKALALTAPPRIQPTLWNRLRSFWRGGNGNGHGLKAFGQMLHGGGAQWDWFLPGTQLDYAGQAGDGLRSSVIVAALNWLMRTFPEAPAVVEVLETEQWRTVSMHPMAQLIRRPNPYYGGRTLWMATVMDFAFGEAFWIKIRNVFGEVVELWWTPRALMTPRWSPDGSDFIHHYDYTPAGRLVELDPEDVVHFRFGMDPQNIRRGFSQLAAVMREVYTDDQASNFTASVLRNLGIIGVVISPKEGNRAGPEDVKEVKAYISKEFTGDNRGKPLALGSPTDVNVMQYNLQGLDLGPIRDISEERVCAALGIPAAVIGFGTGLQQTKVGATMREMIQLAWRGSVMPTQEIIADELDRSLLPEFQSQLNRYRSAFDTSKVHALWEGVSDKHDRVRKDVLASIITTGQAQRELGYPIDDQHDVYLTPTNYQVTPEGEAMPAGAPGPAAAGTGDPAATRNQPPQPEPET